MSNQSYFGGVKDAIKTLTTGLKVTMKEYFTQSLLSSILRTARPRSMCLRVTADVLCLSVWRILRIRRP